MPRRSIPLATSGWDARVSMQDACLARSLGAVSTTGQIAAGAPNRRERTVQSARVPSVLAEHIVFTTDGSDVAMQAVPFASAAIAACEPRRVTVLRVLTAADAGGRADHPVHALDWAMARAQAGAGLERVVSEFAPYHTQVEAVVAEGRAADQILHFADAERVDLLVMASHGLDDARPWRMGGTARKVIADGRVSVLVVPLEPAPPMPVRSIAVPLDCSARAECVLPLATKLAATSDAEIVLVHVVPEPDVPHRLPTGTRDRELAEELTQRNRARAQVYLQGVEQRLASEGVRARSQLLSHTHPARGLQAWLRTGPVDLVLLSAHGASACADEAYGSVVQRLMGSLPTPLWIVQDLPPMREAVVSRGRSGPPERA